MKQGQSLKWDAILLAAGSGTRMKSKTPKVLQTVAGVPMLERVVGQLKKAGCRKVHVVVTSSLQEVVQPLADRVGDVLLHVQAQPLGTGDAVLSVDESQLSELTFICNGDHPLVNEKDIRSLLEEFQNRQATLCVATLEMQEPGSFGRVIKQGMQIKKIVEAKEATAEELKIKDVNTGLYIGHTRNIFTALNDLKNQKRSTKEFYLTDIVENIQSQASEGQQVAWIDTTEDMAFGVNDSEGLYLVNKKSYIQNNRQLLEKGVKFIDIENTYIDDGVEIEEDSFIYPNVYIKGTTKIASGCTIESGVHILNSTIGPNTYIKAGSYIEGAVIDGDASVGPYARLREGTRVEKNVKIGNFVEAKKTHFKEGVKAGHQCYLGDAEIGEGTNIGAGTITCNFAVDGKKYKTVIGKNVFVGSDSQIVPPITIADGAVIAAGATVTKDVESKSLYVTRAKAIVKKNYRD